MLRGPIRTGYKDLLQRGLATGTSSDYDRLLRGSRLPELNDVAVLGGGITGLASAYFTSLRWPTAKITIFESSDRLGGWLRSDVLDVNGGKVVFEQGPRSLRPHKGTLALIVALGLEMDLLITKKDSAAARNRYIYFNDRLVRLGATTKIKDIRSNPLLRTAGLELLGTFFHRPRADLQDESVGQFFRRRGCPETAENVVSAVLHGIYAGDLDELSVISVLPHLAFVERHYGGIYGMLKQYLKQRLGIGSFPRLTNLHKKRMDSGYAADVLKNVSRADEYLSASIYTLKGGLQTLTNALVDKLLSNPQIKIVTGISAEKIAAAAEHSHEPKANITFQKRDNGNRSSADFERIISTIPGSTLAKICTPLKDSLGQGTGSTVCVVNLFYGQPNLTPVRGFGYLIPRSIPRANNPEGAIGVVFDSDATPELDTVAGTKLTVMLGGPFWKDLTSEQLPSNEEAIQMARSVVLAHLGIDASPLRAQANLHANCIPQYTVGHLERMEKADMAMKMHEERWTKCVKVAGSSYNGVGVNDCIQSAYNAAVHVDMDDFFGSLPGWIWDP